MPTHYSIIYDKNKIDTFLGLVYPSLKPKGSLIDIYQDGYWKIGPAAPIQDCQQVWLQEYDVKSSGLIRSADDIVSKALPGGNKTTSGDYYTNIYRGEPTGFCYNLPRILKSGDDIYAPISNSWQKDDMFDKASGFVSKHLQGAGNTLAEGKSSSAFARGLGRVMSYAGRAIQVASDSIGFGTNIMGNEHSKEPIKSFKDTGPYTLTLNFQLYNTPRNQAIDGQQTNHVTLHKDFVECFYFQNLKTRTGPFAMLPPKLYTMNGYPTHTSVTMPVCYVKSYNVKSVGKMHYLSVGGSPVGVPEAYDVTITLENLAALTTNSFAQALGG